MDGLPFFVAEGGLDLHFAPWELNRCSPPSSRRRQRSFVLHLDGFASSFFPLRKEKSHPDWDDFFFSGCGRRTRTSDLRVMSPTSFQLLYPAILGRTS